MTVWGLFHSLITPIYICNCDCCSCGLTCALLLPCAHHLHCNFCAWFPSHACDKVVLSALSVVVAIVLVPLGACSMNIPNWLYLASDYNAFIVFQAIVFITAIFLFILFMVYAKRKLGILL